MTALDYLLGLPRHWLPMSAEKPCQRPSNSELRRWLERRSVHINGGKPGPYDAVEAPITHLRFFEKGKRCATMVWEGAPVNEE